MTQATERSIAVAGTSKDASTNGAGQDAEELHLLALIDEALEAHDDPDPRTLVDEVIERIGVERYVDALRAVLPAVIRNRSAHNRQQDRRRGRAGGDRWSVVRAASGASGLLRWRVNLGDDDWKRFEDCTRSDVERLVKDYTRRAVEQADQAQRYGAVLAEMKRAKVERVGDVNLDKLAAIFYA